MLLSLTYRVQRDVKRVKKLELLKENNPFIFRYLESDNKIYVIFWLRRDYAIAKSMGAFSLLSNHSKINKLSALTEHFLPKLESYESLLQKPNRKSEPNLRV